MNVPREVSVPAALGALLGIIGSGLVNTTPRRIGLHDTLPAPPPIEMAAVELQSAYPDHYPLITPRGRVEVAELAWHGLYRNRRTEPRFEVEWREPEFDLDAGLEDGAEPPEPEAELAEAGPVPVLRLEPQGIPIDPDEAAAQQAAGEARATGGPRLIHVASELAARGPAEGTP